MKWGRREWLGLSHVKDLKGFAKMNDIGYASFKGHLGCCVESRFMGFRIKRACREISVKLLWARDPGDLGDCGREEKWTSWGRYRMLHRWGWVVELKTGVSRNASKASGLRKRAEKRNTRRGAGLMAGTGEGAVHESTFGHVTFETL